MNFGIEGKQRIDKFLQILKLFTHPLFICDSEKMQFLEMRDEESFNELNKSDSPAFFVQLHNDFFCEQQTQIRENHLKFAETTCYNIQLQQEVCQLNSQLKYICCNLPTDIMYKALKPVVQAHLKQIKMSFSYLINDENNVTRQISLKMIVTAYSEKGFFSIMKPIQLLAPRVLEMPSLTNKIMTIQFDSCKTILKQMKSNPISVTCDVDDIHFNPILNEQEQLDIWSTSMLYYNSSLVEEVYGTLKIDSIYGKTYAPILNYSAKIKENCSLFLSTSEINNQDAILYFCIIEEYIILCSRQAVSINREGQQSGKIFSKVCDDLLEEIQILSENNDSKIFQSGLMQPELKNSFHNCIQNESIQFQYSNIKENNSKMYNTMTNQQEPVLFIPPKVTGSINNAILEYMNRYSAKQTDSTISKLK